MSRPTTSVVIDGVLHCIATQWHIQVPEDVYTMTGSDWHGWLKSNSKFRFKYGTDVSYTAYKFKEASWKVQRRVNGRLRNKYLGHTSELSHDRLLDIGYQLALPDELYWQVNGDSTTSQQELRQLNYKIRGANELIEQYLAAHNKDAIPGSPRWEHLRRFRQWLDLQAPDTPEVSE